MSAHDTYRPGRHVRRSRRRTLLVLLAAVVLLSSMWVWALTAPMAIADTQTAQESGCGWDVTVVWDAPAVVSVSAVRTDPDVQLALMMLLQDEAGNTLHASEPSMRESVTWEPPRISTAWVAVVPLAETDGCQVLVPRPVPVPPAYAPPPVVPGDHRDEVPTSTPEPAAQPQGTPPSRLLATR